MNRRSRNRKRSIAVVTSSRSDYAHLRWLLHDLGRHPAIDLRVIALGPHWAPEFGRTGAQVERDLAGKVTAVECLLSSDTDVGMAKSLGVAALGLAEVLGNMRPDLLVLIADRYEMLAPAAIALTLRIPIAHIEGGEITAGAIDDAVRNAITRMSHLHFTCTRRARQRVIAMGENPKRVFFTGSLCLDDLRRSRLLNPKGLEKKLGLSLPQPAVLVVYHPVTLRKDTLSETSELFAALDAMLQPLIFVYPNADAGSRELIARTERFVSRRRDARLLVNLGHITYLSLMANASLLMGNSSSGLIESTSLGVPALNIGVRQRGREHAANVLDVPPERKKILRAAQRALSPQFREMSRGLRNPYGEGKASQRITRMLAKAPLGERLLFKS